MTAAKKPDASKVVAEILAGRYDGKLGDLADAIGKRARGDIRICWRMTLDGDTWDEDTVTIGEMAWAEQYLSTRYRQPVSFLSINPKLRIEHRTALLIAHLHKVQGMKVDDAVKRGESMLLAEQETFFTTYEVGDAPKDDPPPSTSS